ncbi:MAG TPA: hypothetical protein ACFYD2_11890, partial [Candidatus Avalokitesvara rifleensis]|uniref:hypothetical protein n=1 Tax=Candidatus Avalokitesvara rifleensis TaxID=3367620 RepID=UPI004029B618
MTLQYAGRAGLLDLPWRRATSPALPIKGVALTYSALLLFVRRESHFETSAKVKILESIDCVNG